MMLFVDKHAVHAPAVFGTAVEAQRRTRGLQGVGPGTDSRTLWDRLDGETRRMVLDKLLREQGHLCVYCERTIGTGRSRLGAHVEHYLPRHPSRDEYPGLTWTDGRDDLPPAEADAASVDYANLFAVCSNETGRDGLPLTCDKLRGSHRMALDPRDRKALRRLSYKRSGRVEPADPDDETVWDDIGRGEGDTGLLNLNARHLCNARRAAIARLLKLLMSAGDGRAVDAACEREIRNLLAERDPKEPFIEAKLYILTRRESMRAKYSDAYPT